MRKILTFYLFVLFSTGVLAGDFAFRMRHVPGNSSCNFLPGYNPDGYSVELSYNRFKQRDFMYSFILNGGSGSVEQTDYNQLRLGFRPQYILIDLNRTLFLNVFVTAYAGLEFCENKTMSKSDRGPFFTVGMGPELEFYVSNSISIVSLFEQRYNILSKLGGYTYSAKLGVRYIF